MYETAVVNDLGENKIGRKFNLTSQPEAYQFTSNKDNISAQDINFALQVQQDVPMLPTACVANSKLGSHRGMLDLNSRY